MDISETPKSYDISPTTRFTKEGIPTWSYILKAALSCLLFCIANATPMNRDLYTVHWFSHRRKAKGQDKEPKEIIVMRFVNTKLR